MKQVIGYPQRLRIDARLIALWDSSTCVVAKTADLSDQSAVTK